MPFFFAGALAYLLRYRLPYSSPLAFSAALFLLVAGFAVPGRWDGSPVYLLVSLPTVYLIVWTGLSKWPTHPLLGRGDYSYGIYLVGYPLQQLVWLSGLDRGLWWLNSLISLPLALIVASASWHLIEFPILRRRSCAGRRFVTASAEVQAVSGR